jgi:DNA-binding GntR family transcriptional regulator
MRLLNSHPTRVEQVYDALLAAITDGQLRPNERLIQDELAARLGVSRQPIQQALLLLRNDGLVREAAGRGLIVPYWKVSPAAWRRSAMPRARRWPARR